MQRKVRQLNRWLLFFIFLVMLAFPLQSVLTNKLNEERAASFFSFGVPHDDIVMMMYSNTARVGRYLVPIDERNSGAAPYQKDGETLVPARFLASQLEAELIYDQHSGQITMTSENMVLSYAGNNAKIHANGETVNTTLNTPPQVKDGITYVPLRVASNAFDRNLFVKDGIVYMTRNEGAPDIEQWQDWKEDLSAYIAYDTFGPYSVELHSNVQALFKSWNDAVAYASQAPGRIVKYKGEIAMFDPTKQPPTEFRHTGAPLILQLPELPRGCEVTALAMLLQSNGVQVDKMELAEKIRKDPTPYSRQGNVTYFGNPHDGFVGDMYTFDNPGLGVYHEPIAELAEQYLPGQVFDMTGTTFEHLLWTVGQGMPTWVIHTTMYDEVPASAWVNWQTPSGPIQVTYYEHSLLVTGYDEQYVFVHDPLGRRDRIERSAFQAGWEQMGSQAINILPQIEN